MPAELASVAEFKTYLELTGSGQEAALQQALEDAEAMLEERTGLLFSENAATATDEAYNGSGTRLLFLKRRAASVASVKIGIRVAAPDETILTADLAVYGRQLLRLDGCTFPLGTFNVFVTYDVEASLPAIAKAAVLEGAAFLWRRRGREHVAAQTLDEFGSVSLAAQMDRLPKWGQAIDALSIGVYA